MEGVVAWDRYFHISGMSWIESAIGVAAVGAEVDRFFAVLPPRRASGTNEFLVELRDALPKRYAEQAEAIYLRHAESSR
jgi:hypothetical protein